MKTKITDKIKTFEDACKILGIKKRKSIKLKLVIIAKVFNQGWDPDWDQPKKTIKTRNGSRLCYKNEKEQAEYYGEIFKQMYDDFMRK